jgi:hypothetical protein
VTTAPKPEQTQSKAKIATMLEPSDERMASALVATVYLARDSLSMSERQADVKYPQAPVAVEGAARGVRHLADGLHFLRAALLLIEPWYTAGAIRVRSHIALAIHAAEAASGHAALVRELVRSGERKDDAEEKERARQYTIWRNAAKHARQEAHRALAELAEEFPAAYDTED